MRLKYGARHPSGERKSRFSRRTYSTHWKTRTVDVSPMTMRHAARGLRTPLGHKDPFDELLLVQAQEEGLRLLTADRRLVGHPLAVAAHELE